MSRLLLTELAAKPIAAINPWRGATAADVVDETVKIELLFDLFGSALLARLQNLAENLPVGTLNIDEHMDRLADLRGELVGALMNAEEVAASW